MQIKNHMQTKQCFKDIYVHLDWYICEDIDQW